ncbi:hypothetical protein KFE25_011372 [Diacronema lutheri]|uniref:Nicotinate-nucleotide--dimethylbenzimidazole phosphoribosyltransferase n=1 Tax=Diacronema lutheri TaxID=2081491 RepID=A0A8J6C3A9_DIALT|nr:hypothetical protein KFE25_011372 [Diacronema lutheri]
MGAALGIMERDEHERALEAARARLRALAKPVGSLGALEDWAARLAALQRPYWPAADRPAASVRAPALLVFAADHGCVLAHPSLSAFPRAVTLAIFRTIAAGGAASAVLAKANGASLELIDVGVDGDTSTAGRADAAYGDVAGGARARDDKRSPSEERGVGSEAERRPLPTEWVSHAAPHVRVLVRKVAPYGTANSGTAPAMSRAQCAAAMAEGAAAVRRIVARALPADDNDVGLSAAATETGAASAAAAAEGEREAGRDRARAARARRQERGANVVCLGELGIGNTTAAAALLVALARPLPADTTRAPAPRQPLRAVDAVGVGTGLDEAARLAKAAFVERALARHAQLIAAEGALGALRALGGLELAAMAGAVIEAARLRVAVVIDGFIAGAAALAAIRLAPSAAAALFISHRSAERGASALAAQLQAAGCGPAALDLGMRLGEGTGSLVALGVLRSAAAVLEMATLQEATAL